MLLLLHHARYAEICDVLWHHLREMSETSSETPSHVNIYNVHPGGTSNEPQRLRQCHVCETSMTYQRCLAYMLGRLGVDQSTCGGQWSGEHTCDDIFQSGSSSFPSLSSNLSPLLSSSSSSSSSSSLSSSPFSSSSLSSLSSSSSSSFSSSSLSSLLFSSPSSLSPSSSSSSSSSGSGSSGSGRNALALGAQRFRP